MRGFILFTLCVTLAGCGGGSGLDLHPAGGKVTYNGKPVPNATVSFISDDSPLAIATTDAEGEFSLRTGTEQGATSGTYKVTVYATEGSGQAATIAFDPADPAAYSKAYTQAAEQQKESKSAVPEKYTKELSTPLTFEVKEGEENNFDIALTD